MLKGTKIGIPNHRAPNQQAKPLAEFQAFQNKNTLYIQTPPEVRYKLFGPRKDLRRYIRYDWMSRDKKNLQIKPGFLDRREDRGCLTLPLKNPTIERSKFPDTFRSFCTFVTATTLRPSKAVALSNAKATLPARVFFPATGKSSSRSSSKSSGEIHVIWGIFPSEPYQAGW